MRRLRSGVGAGLLLAAVGLTAPVSSARADTRPSCLGDRATIVGTSGDDVIRGTRGDDVIAARGGDDVVRGGGGADIVCGGRGADRVRDVAIGAGGPGDDVVRLASAGDRGAAAIGGASDDVLVGTPGADDLHGSAPAAGIGGNPVPVGSDDDRIVGGGGDDGVTVTAGNDVVRTGAGRDLVEVQDTTSGVDLDLGGDADEAEVSMPASARLSLAGGGGDAVDLLLLVLATPPEVRPTGRLDLAASIFTAGGPPGSFSGWDSTTVLSTVDWTIVGTDRQEDFLVNGGSVHATLRGGTDNITVLNDGPRPDYVDGGEGHDRADVGTDPQWDDEGDVCVDVEAGDCAPRD